MISSEAVVLEEKRFQLPVNPVRSRFDVTRLIGTQVPRLLQGLYPDLLWRVPTRRRTAYLTFDDGPTPQLTGRLLDLLAQHGAKATFFLIGEEAERDPGLVRAMVEGGHTIGNHTYTHPDAWRTPRGQVLRELSRTSALLEDQTQKPVRWMRPPYGRFTQSMRSWALVRRQRLTMWDLMPGDYLRNATADKVEQRVLSDIRPGSIIVLHDNPKAEHVTPSALARILTRLTDDGWSLEAL